MKGSLVASHDSEILIRKVVESFDEDKEKLGNSAAKAMRKAFLSMVAKFVGK